LENNVNSTEFFDMSMPSVCLCNMDRRKLCLPETDYAPFFMTFTLPFFEKHFSVPCWWHILM